MAHALVDRFIQYFEQFSQDKLQQMDALFSEAFVFVDPIHHISGIVPYQRYLTSLYENTQSCVFTVQHYDVIDSSAWIIWKMDCVHTRLNHGRPFQLEGVTHLKFDHRITYQRDYYDLGALIYENIPLLRRVILWLKKRMMQS
jgi:hypothetical protein